MSKLIYLDSFSVGAFHEMYNASSLKMFMCLYDKVIYYSTKSSYCAVCNIFSEAKNVVHKTIWMVGGNTSFRNALHHLFACIVNLIVLFCVSRSFIVVINYNCLWGFGTMNWIIKRRHLKVMIVCHGEMEYLNSVKKLNCFSQKSLNKLKNSKLCIANDLYLCVLGQNILQNIKQCLPYNVSSHFICFEHSLMPKDVPPQKVSGNIIRFAMVGTIHQGVALDNLIKVSKAVCDKKQIEIYALGRVFCNAKILLDNGIKIIPNSDKEFVHRKLLENYIENMDAILVLHPCDSYKFTASAAVHDAVNNEKFIIGLKNNYYNHFFNLVRPGKLCDTIEELIEFIRNVSKPTLYQIDFKNNKKILSPENVAKAFKPILSQKGLI